MAEKEKGKGRRALNPAAVPRVGAEDFELGPEVTPGPVFPGQGTGERKEKERGK
ncbi:MAG: hypothetical protein IMW96_00465 [Thermoanaerobacteraceae bacterium]|nr:hypothetical protein [Thermoanaerobacteraceae bacterium]